jgi:hypothetical protein
MRQVTVKDSYPVGSKYLYYINLQEYTIILSEVIENEKEPERKYRMEYDKKHKWVPGLKIVCTGKELAWLEEVKDEKEKEKSAKKSPPKNTKPIKKSPPKNKKPPVTTPVISFKNICFLLQWFPTTVKEGVF